MTRGRVLLALALVGAWFFFKWPSATRIVSDTTVAVDEGWVDYKDVRYEAEWGDEVVRAGHARLFERAKYKSAPFFTHHTVLTTGDYSDSELVEIRHSGGGNFFWTSPRKPEGSLVALHIVPLNDDVLDQLRQIDDGDRVELVGRDEADGEVRGSDGSWLKLAHSNHRYMLVERATLLAD